MDVDEEFYHHYYRCWLLVPELDCRKPHSLPADATSQPIPTTIRSLRTRTTWIRPDPLDHWPNYQDFHHYNSELLDRQRRSRLCVMNASSSLSVRGWCSMFEQLPFATLLKTSAALETKNCWLTISSRWLVKFALLVNYASFHYNSITSNRKTIFDYLSLLLFVISSVVL